MKTLTIALNKGLCIALLSTCMIMHGKTHEGDALYILSHDIIVYAKTDKGLHARLTNSLSENIINASAGELAKHIRGLDTEIHDKVCRALNDKERSTLMAVKFRELLNPTADNKHYSILLYTDYMGYLCEKTGNKQFAHEHAQFTKQLAACANQVASIGLRYLFCGFKNDLAKAFASLKGETTEATKQLLNHTLEAEMKKHGQGGLINILRGRARGTR